MPEIQRFRAAACLLAVLLLGAAPSVRERLTSFYTGWFARIPGTHFKAAEAAGVRVPGLTAYLVSRVPDAAAPSRPSRDESVVGLHDPASGELFVGEVLHDSQRAAAGRPFQAAADLPNVQASLEEGFGVPVRIEQRGPARGALLPLEVMTRLEGETFASRPGFVSSDGASVLIGEFHPLAESPEAWRRKRLSESPGVRVEAGSFLVTEFLDFQCERCRRRTPEARAAARQAGAALDVRFLPLVKSHEWSFAAAESAAAVAALGAVPYSRYEEMVFARSEGLSASGARQLAADVAESAGEKERFEAELSSGRARARVVRDVELAGRIGVGGTPAFLVEGRLVPGDRGFLEREIALRSPK